MPTPRVPRMRSALYVPGFRRDFLEKTARSGADAVILDLEDSVPIPRRDEARAEIARWMTLPNATAQITSVRINALDQNCLEEDLAAAVAAPLVVLQISKVTGVEDVVQVEAALARHEARTHLPPGSVLLWPLLETPRSVHQAYEIAVCSPRVAYMGVGCGPRGDLARQLGIQETGTFMESLYVRSKVLLDVRAAGILNPMGSMTPIIGDTAAIETHARFIRSLGYEGMSLIHPSQVPIANAVFGPTEADVQAARRLIAVLEQALAEGKGAVLHEGRMIDAAHLQSAHDLVAEAEEFGRRAART